MRAWFLAIAVLLTPSADAQTQYYKCKDEHGRPVFSQRPCGADAQAATVQTPGTSGSVTPGDFSAVAADNDIRAAERKIKQFESKIKRLELERDNKVTPLREERSRASKDVAVPQYLQSLTTEMQSTARDYNSRISAVRREISELKTEVRRANAQR